MFWIPETRNDLSAYSFAGSFLAAGMMVFPAFLTITMPGTTRVCTRTFFFLAIILLLHLRSPTNVSRL